MVIIALAVLIVDYVMLRLFAQLVVAEPLSSVEMALVSLVKRLRPVLRTAHGVLMDLVITVKPVCLVRPTVALVLRVGPVMMIAIVRMGNIVLAKSANALVIGIVISIGVLTIVITEVVVGLSKRLDIVLINS